MDRHLNGATKSLLYVLIVDVMQVAMVEADLPSHISTDLLVAFAVTTTILIAVHLFALMVSTCILPHIDAVATRRHSPESGAIVASPHKQIRKYIEIAWIFSTCIGIVLFLLELAIICWIKFADVSPDKVKITGNVNNSSSVDLDSTEVLEHGDGRWIAALVANLIIAFVVVIFLLFAARFYHYIVLHKYEVSSKAIAELQQLTHNLDQTNNDGKQRATATASVKPYVHIAHTNIMSDDLDSESSSYHEAKSTMEETGV